MANELGHRITMEIEINVIGSWQLRSTPSFRLFEKYPTEVCVYQHYIPGTANGHGNHAKFEDLILCKVGKLQSLK
jgi:hypothetical protein